MQRKPVDIEKLVQWAFREELPKGHAVDSPVWNSLESFMTLGTRVQTSGRGAEWAAGLGWVDGEPHPDAPIVGAAVKALPVALALGGDADVENILGPLVNLDSRVIPALVSASFALRSTIFHHAAMGTRPVWDIGSPMPQRTVRPGQRHALVIWQDRDGEWQEGLPPTGRRYPIDSLAQCPITWDEPSVIAVAEARVDYIIWHRGLTLLADQLADQLAEHRPLPPQAAPVPWVADTEQRGQTLVNKAAAHMTHTKPLPLHPQRPAPRLPPLKTRPGARASVVRDVLDGAA